MTMSKTDSTISRVAARASARQAGERRLRVVFPAELEATIALDKDKLTLGRDPEGAGPRLRHPTVSRRHLELEWDASVGTFRAHDLGSHNGSWLDGAKLDATPRPLVDASVIRLGDLFLVYEASRTVVGDADDVAREAIPGDSLAVRAVRAAVSRAAPDPSSVLLIGETGTGKESIAAELHRLSGRRGQLVAVNCAALSPQLVEAQLFGHVRGAFTGATESQPGLFRAAHEGTLFLDEIGELPLELQPKLLRAIQEREIQPVGSAKPIKVDARVIAATNRDLAALAESGEFRRDLYARLALWEIRVPPLRARRGDLFQWIRILHEHWASDRKAKTQPIAVSADAADAILLSAWPDNLRGLDRMVHALAADSKGQPFAREALPSWLLEPVKAAPAPARRAVSAPAAEPEEPGGGRRPTPTREELADVLAKHNGSVRATAKHFGRDRRQIYRWLDAYGLKAKRD